MGNEMFYIDDDGNKTDEGLYNLEELEKPPRKLKNKVRLKNGITQEQYDKLDFDVYQFYRQDNTDGLYSLTFLDRDVKSTFYFRDGFPD